MSSTPTAPCSYRLPDLQAIWTHKPRFNVHYEEASASSQEWFLSHNLLKGKNLEIFKECGGELLCAWAFPYAGLQQLRTVCDLVNLLFMIDTISDEQNGRDALATGMQFYHALEDDSYDDGTVLCRMTKEFKRRFLPYAGQATNFRFLEHSKNYVLGFAREAELREQGVVLDFATFKPFRRENSGARYVLGAFGYLLSMDLPTNIFEHPVYMEMHLAAIDMICWSNDIYSYNVGQAMGHFGNNILTVLQREEGIDLQAATYLAAEHFQERSNQFNAAKARLPSFGKELDEITANHVMAMEAWVAGNLEWSFATRRYFGKNHLKVRETLVVELSPPKEHET